MLNLLLLAALLPIQVDEDAPRPVRRRALDTGLAPRFSVWQPNLNGKFDADEGFAPAIDGTNLSLDHDLDIDDETAFPIFEFGFTEVFRYGDHETELERITVSFWANEWEGDVRLDSTEVFNQRFYPAGTDVHTRFRVGVFGLDSLVLAAGIPEANVDGGFTVGMRIIDVKAALTSTTEDASERTRLLYFGCGFRGEWHPAPWMVASAWGSVYFSFGEIDDIFQFEDWSGVDLEGGVSAGYDFGFVRLEVGLRFIANAFNVFRDDPESVEENDFSFLAGGPFVSASIRF